MQHVHLLCSPLLAREGLEADSRCSWAEAPGHVAATTSGRASVGCVGFGPQGRAGSSGTAVFACPEFCLLLLLHLHLISIFLCILLMLLEKKRWKMKNPPNSCGSRIGKTAVV